MTHVTLKFMEVIKYAGESRSIEMGKNALIACLIVVLLLVLLAPLIAVCILVLSLECLSVKCGDVEKNKEKKIN